MGDLTHVKWEECLTPPRRNREALRQAGYADDAIKEIAYIAAMANATCRLSLCLCEA